MMQRKILSALVFISIFLTLAGRASAVTGSDWRAGRIIDDYIFTNKDDMSVAQIQNFLNQKVSSCDTYGTAISELGGGTRAEYGAAHGNPIPFTCLRDYYEVPKLSPGPGLPASNYGGVPIPSGAKSAAQLIYDAAQTYSINPKVLLVKIQKESAGPLTTDTWPFKSQYTYAMGAHCPDSGPGGAANCDPNYAGFSIQISESAALLRYYLDNMTQPWWAYKKLGNNDILYQNSKPECGSSIVSITTKATAALYTYTPYQPNQAALNNLYGLGDSCSAYGNRNFWRIFNDWFGPTLTDGFTIALTDDGSNAQYLLFGGLKQSIPDPETKIAWGLQDYPLTTMSASYLASIPSGPTLDRLTRLNTSDLTVFFMDGGKRYRVMSQQMFNAWNFGGRPITSVPPSLFYVPSDGGELTYTVKNPANSNLYMVDGANGSSQTVLRPFQSDTVQKAWEGESSRAIEPSTDFFNQIDNAIGTTLISTKIANSGAEYQVVDGSRMSQPAPFSALYPGVAQSVSQSTMSRLADRGIVSHLVRSVTENTVYLIDNNSKRAVANPSVLAAWQYPGSNVELVNSSYVSLIPNGTALTTYVADSGGQLYLMNGKRYVIPSTLNNAYAAITTSAITTSLISLYPNSSASLTGFVRALNDPKLYLLDNSGQKRHIDRGDKAVLMGAYTTGVTLLPSSIVDIFPVAASPETFVSDGTNEYVIEDGSKHPVDVLVKADWGLSSAQVYSDGTLSRFPTAASLTSKIRDGSSYYLVKGGRAFLTVDINIAGTWAITDAPQMNSAVITSRLYYYMLTRFVRSTTDSRTFIIDNGNWYALSNTQLANLGGFGAPTMGLEPANAPNVITDWTAIVVKDSVGKHYVIDSGTKRSFANSIIQNHWTSNGSLSVPTVTNGFLNLLPNNGTVERAIKGSTPSVYSAENGMKRHILYPNTYIANYAPYCIVSDALINALPTGSPI